ncbi:MAG TPA: hypothetical protein VGP88_06590 [Thermoplasmata archaeon]|jgi:hypothetical protein|nr:hypothetical protein [Thermoplasmata archaeon]
MRSRRRRAEAGQVSAIAVLFGLLLVVSMIAQFVTVQLPQDMRSLEAQHELTVENQVSRLQATVLAQIGHAPFPQSLGSPITLGSDPEPPFGVAATGSISTTSYSSQESVGLAVPVPPNWGHGNLCTTFTSGTCHNSQSNVCGPGLRYNESATNSSVTFALTGSNDCIVLNFTGNGDTITLGVTGSNLGYFVLDLFGFNDTVVLNNQFSGSGFHAFFYLFGGYDTYKASGGPTGSGMYLNTYFVGQSASGGICPSNNLSATDKWSIQGSSSSNSLQNLTWNNSVGYATPYHKTSGWPGTGNSGTGNHVGWQNVTAATTCAFVKQKSYGNAWGGLSVTMNNLYLPQATVALDSGAVIESGPSGSVMISPPPWSQASNGTAATPLSFTFLTFTSASKVAEAGRTTAAVLTHIVTVSTATITTGSVAVSIVTAYPQAWFDFLTSGVAGNVPASTTCSGTVATCVVAPAGTFVTISTLFNVSSITLTWAVVSLSLE